MTRAEQIAEAVERLDAWQDGDEYLYYAEETSEHYILTEDELVELSELMHSDDPDIAGSAYSHWCNWAGELVDPEDTKKKRARDRRKAAEIEAIDEGEPEKN